MHTSIFPRAGALLLIAAVVTVFTLDWHTPLGFGIFVLYAPICLMYLWRNGWRASVVAGGVCSILVIVGYVLSSTGIPSPWSVLNRGVALLVLWSVIWGGTLVRGTHAGT